MMIPVLVFDAVRGDGDEPWLVQSISLDAALRIPAGN